MNAQVECSNPQCRVAESGKCVEGLATDKCPNFGRLLEDADTLEPLDPGSDGGLEATSTNSLSLCSSQLLTVAEARAVSRQRVSLYVATIGPSDAGKTSLIASLYERFQSGPLEGLSYVWSDTLHAFERACHHSRVASKRNVPDTERTKIGTGLKFYHLRICDPEHKDLDLLLSDRAGEDYWEASNDPDAVKGYAELKQADAINVLVDGKRLADVARRHNLKSEVSMVLQGIVDSGVLGVRRRLAIVLTKLDVIHASDRKDNALSEFDQLVDGMTQRFGTNFEEIRAFKVAACPTEHVDLGRGYGLSELLAYWRDVGVFKTSGMEPPEATRYFQRVRAAGGIRV